MIRLLKEPLVHFLVLGGGLFLLFGLMGGGEGEAAEEGESQNEVARFVSKEINVGKGDIESFIAQYAKVWQRTPTEKELAGLIENYIQEEVMYRQALELELDRDD